MLCPDSKNIADRLPFGVVISGGAHAAPNGSAIDPLPWMVFHGCLSRSIWLAQLQQQRPALLPCSADQPSKHASGLFI